MRQKIEKIINYDVKIIKQKIKENHQRLEEREKLRKTQKLLYNIVSVISLLCIFGCVGFICFCTDETMFLRDLICALIILFGIISLAISFISKKELYPEVYEPLLCEQYHEILSENKVIEFNNPPLNQRF